MSGKPMCKGKTWDGYGYLHCSHRATMPSGYCKIHDPETMAARRKARNDKWNAKRQETLKKYAEEKKVQEFREHAAKHYDAMLAALKDAENHLAELSEAWRRGALNETDCLGGTRSNRNSANLHNIRATIDAAEKDVTP